MDVFTYLTEDKALPPCQLVTFQTDDSNDRLLRRLFSPESQKTHPAILLCDDYLICTGTGTALFEIIIFRTVSLYDNVQIAEMLSERSELLKKGNFTQSPEISSDSGEIHTAIITEKNFVVLLATNDNDYFYNRLLSLPE